jgi:hypothetical protein
VRARQLYHSGHKGLYLPSCKSHHYPALSQPYATGPYRSFAHTIGYIEHILQPPRGGDDHDEPPASRYHHPCRIYGAQVVASRWWSGEGKGMSCVNAVAWVLQALAASCALGGCNQWERLQSYRPEKWTGGHILREKLVK